MHARLQMIRVGMNTQHINHNTDYTIPKQLKKVNPNYITAHFGKWGMDSNPETLGYDISDGATKNKDPIPIIICSYFLRGRNQYPENAIPINAIPIRVPIRVIIS